MRILAIMIAVVLGFSLAGCGALVPFGVGAAVGTAVSNAHNAPPNYIPPRPKR